MSVNYLEFKYHYNLIVEDNNKGFEWKPLSVCTESKVLLNEHKVIQCFNLSEIYLNYEISIYNNNNYQREYNSGFIAMTENSKILKNAQFFVAFVHIIFR